MFEVLWSANKLLECVRDGSRIMQLVSIRRSSRSKVSTCDHYLNDDEYDGFSAIRR